MSFRLIVILGIVALVSGCAKVRDDKGRPAAESSVVFSPQFPRLTHVQWENTIRDLFELPDDASFAAMFLPDPPLGRFDNNELRLRVTSGLWSDYQRAAEEIAERVAGDPALLTVIAPGEASVPFIESFGLRALRRPLTKNEVDSYSRLFADGAAHYAEMAPFAAGVRFVVEAMLQSPFFLYRTELTGLTEEGVVALTDYEVASRLSYALWNTMPDDALFEAAAAGELSTEVAVRAMATAMFDDSRSRAQFAHFHFQAFEMHGYLDLDKDTELFPSWHRDTGESMRIEAELFLGDVLFGGGSVRDILTSRTAFVNAEIAAVYGVDGEFSEEFVKVELDPTRRSGLLTRAGFLAKNATLREPDPIHRGVFANLNLLCRDLPAVPDLPDNLMPVGNTNRERVHSITGPGTCGEGCHGKLINPLGFALENYDALGAWRDTDNGFPIDAADTYRFADGTEISFANGMELSDQLAEAEPVHECYIRHLLEYVFGRELVEADDGTVAALAELSHSENLSLREVLVEMASADAFRFRTMEKR